MSQAAIATARSWRASIHLHPAMTYEQRVGVLLKLLERVEAGEEVDLV